LRRANGRTPTAVQPDADAHAGRPPGAGITVHARGDGIIVRITDQAGRWYEVFLDSPATENLVEMLTDDPSVWGWRPR
jgi:hypothetical protein